MLYFTRSDIAPNWISIDPFRELIAPLLAWGVVCVTPMAWLMALWCGGQYVRLSSGRPGSLGPALVGAALGLSMGIIFVLVSAWAMPVDPAEVSKVQTLTVVITVGGIVICAALSTFTARATLRRYASDK